MRLRQIRLDFLEADLEADIWPESVVCPSSAGVERDQRGIGAEMTSSEFFPLHG
jgi:hypothetical protein